MSKSKKKKQKKFCREESLTGIFSASRQGFGFVALEKEEIFIPARFVRGAIDGDKVSVKITARDNPLGPTGMIESILERNRSLVVGTVVGPHEIRPLESALPVIAVSGGLKGAKRGDWVRARLLSTGKKYTEKLKCSIEEVLGRSATIAGDLLAVAKEYDLPEPYSPATELYASRLKPLELERTALAKEFVITVDPADAHDFDDALSIREEGSCWVIGVHIADVAAWIRPGTKLDQAAYDRGFSSYIPTMFRPMLPKPLTAKISLRQGELSPAHTIELTVRKTTGRVVSHARFHSLVKVSKRLDYDTVQQFLDGKPVPKNVSKRLQETLSMLAKAVRKMRKFREKQEEFLQIETAETRVLVDEERDQVTGLEKRIQREAESLVEECMLAANTAAAEEMIEKGIPGLYRIHSDPDPAKLEEFSAFAEPILKRKTGDLSSRTVLYSFLKDLPDNQTKGVLCSALLRAMSRACYSADPALHYGLGKTRYAHFTSPIRRYADLFTHQQLLMHDLNKRMLPKSAAAIVGDVLRRLEKRNDEAYFAACDRLKLHFLKQFLCGDSGTMFEAVVIKNNAQGLLCDLPEYGIRGLVPARLFNTLLKRRPPKPGNVIYLFLDSLDFAAGTAFFRPV